MVISIIPARGGSKGVPGKNVKELAEYPLIAYSISGLQAIEEDYANHCLYGLVRDNGVSIELVEVPGDG